MPRRLFMVLSIAVVMLIGALLVVPIAYRERRRSGGTAESATTETLRCNRHANGHDYAMDVCEFSLANSTPCAALIKTSGVALSCNWNSQK